LKANIPYSNKRILVCPLDWGLGHAARCVPLIKQLQAQNNSVVVACNTWQKDFLENEIAEVEFTPLFGYEVKYSEKISLGLKLLSQFPRLSLLVKKENSWLAGFLKENKFDVVISDNRFGLHNKQVESVFMTHQLFVIAPFLNRIANKLNASFIKNFDACWVPDLEDKKSSLSGALSHGRTLPANVKYMGPLSRFEKKDCSPKKNSLLILLSGVEPQRTLLEEKLVLALAENNHKITLVRGTNKKTTRRFPENFDVLDLVNSKQLEEFLLSHQKIICRSGYSTLMDLHALRLKALLIPTPGQTEQEYLAAYWHKTFGFHFLPQSKISKKDIAEWLAAAKDPEPHKQFA